MAMLAFMAMRQISGQIQEPVRNPPADNPVPAIPSCADAYACWNSSGVHIGSEQHPALRWDVTVDSKSALSDTWWDNQQPAASADSQSPLDIPIQPTIPQNHNPSEAVPKRILGIIPNYRTSPSLKDYTPLTPKGKFKMASQDSFDRGTFILGGLFGGEAQLTKATPSFGQGVPGYARYFSTSYADFVIGNFMTEAIYPTVLRQDPRYFRRGTGSVLSRLGYAVGQIFWTHKDSGGMQFNFSEVVGNSTAVALSNAYYPDNRTVSDAISKLGVQIGVDMAGNILKEFSPELARTFSRKHHPEDDAKSPKH